MTGRGAPGRGEPGDALSAAAGTARTLGTGRQGTAPRATNDQVPRRVLSVRRATIADLPMVVELRIALLRENGEHPVYGQLRADARERAYDVFGAQLRSPHEVIFLAETSDGVVGILRCVETLNSPLLEPDRYCYISSVYVRPNARRSGVLNAMMRRATDWCRDRGLTEMRLHNVPGGSASAAWSAEGFAVMEEVRRKGLERG